MNVIKIPTFHVELDLDEMHVLEQVLEYAHDRWNGADKATLSLCKNMHDTVVEALR